MAVAVVQNLTGEVWARAEDGSVRQLRNGDELQAGEVIFTGENGSAEIAFESFGGGVLELLANQIVELAENIEDSEPAPVPEALVTETSIANLLELLEGEGDLLEQMEAAAAGVTGGEGNEGHSFVRVGRIAENLDPIEFAFDPGLDFRTLDLPIFEDEGGIAIPTPTPTPPAPTPTPPAPTPTPPAPTPTPPAPTPTPPAPTPTPPAPTPTPPAPTPTPPAPTPTPPAPTPTPPAPTPTPPAPTPTPPAPTPTPPEPVGPTVSHIGIAYLDGDELKFVKIDDPPGLEGVRNDDAEAIIAWLNEQYGDTWVGANVKGGTIYEEYLADGIASVDWTYNPGGVVNGATGFTRVDEGGPDAIFDGGFEFAVSPGDDSEESLFTAPADDPSEGGVIGLADAIALDLAAGDLSVDGAEDRLAGLGDLVGEPAEESLSLGDLLEGATMETISDYLSLNFDGTDTIIEVQSGLSGGVSQQIVLAGLDPTGLGDSDQEILAKLINDGMLKIDT